MNTNTLIIFGIIIFIIICLFVLLNKLAIKKNNVLFARSTIDVMLKKRYDLIPKLVDVVKAYDRHEEKVLERISLIRKEAMDALEQKDIINYNEELNNLLNELFVNVENYPKLRSNINYIQLQTMLKNVEDEISAARRNYNSHVTIYNTFISMIPVNIIAFIFGYRKIELFKMSDIEKNRKSWADK